MAKKSMYLVLFSIWHTGDKKYYEPGALVSMDHLPSETVEKLAERKVIAPETAYTLPLLGIGPDMTKKLVEKGIYSLEGLLEKEAREISRETGIAESILLGLQKKAKSLPEKPVKGGGE